jgi:hypothetical protein
MLEELGCTQTLLTPLHADNTNTIQISVNLVFHERTKHIEICCHYIRYMCIQLGTYITTSCAL